VEVLRKPRKPLPEEVAKMWAQEWAKEGKEVDWQRLMPARGFTVLSRRWVVERTFAWVSHNRRMTKDYERLSATGEAFCLRGDDASYGEEVGRCVGLSRQSLEGAFSEVRNYSGERRPTGKMCSLAECRSPYPFCSTV
jgi:hypothetical protein